MQKFTVKAHNKMSFLIFYFFVVFVTIPSVVCQTAESVESDHSKLPTTVNSAEMGNFKLTVPELIRKYGYPVEEHEVTTKDGYILTLHRIPYGRLKGSTNKEKSYSKTVFLQHEILSSSADWIVPGPEKGLAYLLADKDFDVWMGNARGNTYSRRHRKFISIIPDFWDFTFHEIGKYDMPAMIDYILRETGEERLFTIGYGQGSASFFVMASIIRKYRQKTIAHISLAPVTYMGHVHSPLYRIVAFWSQPLSILFEFIGQWEFLPNHKFVALVADQLCKDDAITQVLCKHIVFAYMGYSPKEFNATLLPLIAAFYPAGASTKQMLHLAQLGSGGGHFRRYDYGAIENMIRYKSIKPPNYKLKEITTPVFMIYCENDWFSSMADAERLCSELGNCKKKFLVKEKAMNHLDFVFGKNVKKLVYDRVLRLVRRLSSKSAQARRFKSIATANYCNFIWIFVCQSIHSLLTQW